MSRTPSRAKASPRRGKAALGWALGFIVGVAIVGASIAAYHAIAVATGFYAKVLCSGVFVSGRAAAQVVADDLRIHPPVPMMRAIDWSIDESTGRVRARWLGLAERSAFYDGAQGCALHAHRPLAPRAVVRPTSLEFDLAIRPDPRVQAIANRAFEEPDADRPRRTKAIVVVHRARIVAEAYTPGYDAQTPLAGWSMAKSVLNALVGIGVGRGEFEHSSRLVDLASAPWWHSGDARSAITIEHALTMTTGLRFDESYANPFSDVMRMLLREPSLAAYAASKALAYAPGTHWQYASGTSNLLARVLTADAREHVAHDRLFERIGMTSAVFERDAAGTPVGSSYLYATARDWARFGWLYAADGRWGEQRILPEGWVAYSRTPVPGSDGRYGAHFWLGHRDSLASADPPPDLPADLFYAAGHAGQRVTIIPSRSLVVVRLGQTLDRGGWDQPRFVAAILRALPAD